MDTLIFLILMAVAAIVLTYEWNYFSKKLAAAGSDSHKHKDDDGLSLETTVRIFRIATIVTVAAFFLVLLWSSVLIVPSGSAANKMLFGVIEKEPVMQGLHAVNPLASYTEVNIQRNGIIVEDASSDPKEHGMKATTRDNVQATVEANFTYQQNPDYIWWVAKYIGGTDKVRGELLEKAAQSATRDALGHYTLEEAQVTKRDSFELLLSSKFKNNIIANLPKKELDTADYAKVFEVLPTQLMNVIPDPKVANALSEKKATAINLENQVTLTSIATEQANRRREEGKGIKKLFDELPTSYGAKDVAMILNAISNKERADAVMKVATDGKINWGLMEGTGTVAAPKPAE